MPPWLPPRRCNRLVTLGFNGSPFSLRLACHARLTTFSVMHCAIDFGTSNSAVAIPATAGDAVRLVPLEGEHTVMPTAVFYFAEGAQDAGPPRAFGRAAVAAYVDGIDGRLMRSMKSLLGSDLIEQTTDAGGGRGVKYLDVIAGYLRHLKLHAEAAAGGPLHRVVLGRPVFFVDGDTARDAAAQAALRRRRAANGICRSAVPIRAAGGRV